MNCTPLDKSPMVGSELRSPYLGSTVSHFWIILEEDRIHAGLITRVKVSILLCFVWINFLFDWDPASALLEFSVLQKNDYCRIILCCGAVSRVCWELVLLAQLFLRLPCLDDVRPLWWCFTQESPLPLLTASVSFGPASDVFIFPPFFLCGGR